MCIYFKGSIDLAYSSEEHVFPQALGGKLALPVGYVSDKFNNGISKLEQELIRDSFIGTIRQFYGPGKKGSLSEGKASKSRIHVITRVQDATEVSLGYTQQKLNVEIPQARINVKTGLVSFFFTPQIYGEFKTEVEKYCGLCSIPEKLKIKIIKTDALDEDTIIFAIQDKVEENHNSFLAVNPQSSFVLTPEIIKGIGQAISFDNPISSNTGELQIKHKTFIDLSHLRVFAKIAFNFLALKMGQDFVLDGRFDALRNWIITGDTPGFANYDFENPKPFKSSDINFPEDAHLVFITKRKDVLLAKVILYNQIAALIQLTTGFSEPFEDISLVCDWQNRKEYSLKEFIQASILGYWPDSTMK